MAGSEALMGRRSRLSAGRRGRPAWTFDVALALLLAVFQTGSLWLVPPGHPMAPAFDGPDGLAVLLALSSSLPLVARRRAPAVVLAVVGLTAVAQAGLGIPAQGLGLVVALYSVAVYAPRRESLGALGVFVLFAGVSLVLSDAVQYAGANALVFLTAWLLGDQRRAIRERMRAVAERSLQLERERADRARLAVLQERERLAGQLRDVVRHGLAAMVAQARSAERLVDGDPLRAPGALEAVEATGRDSLAELRRLLSLLRGTDEAELQPQPGLADVGALVERFRRAGLDTALRVEGVPRPVPRVAELSAYRLVQDALTAALQPGQQEQAAVVLRFTADTLDVDVLGRAQPGAEGLDGTLAGARQRVALLGGTLLEAAPGALLRARLPTGGPCGRDHPAVALDRSRPVSSRARTAGDDRSGHARLLDRAVEQVDRLRAALGRRPLVVRDGLLAAAVAAVDVSLLWLHDPVLLDVEGYAGPSLQGVVVLLLLAAPLAWRRVQPHAVMALTLAGAVSAVLLSVPTQLFPPLVALYTVAAYRTRQQGVAWLLLSALLAAALMLRAGEAQFLAGHLVILATAWLLGDRTRSLTARDEALQQRAAALTEQRERAASLAAADERTRIARELHDILAHSMSLMVVQAAAAGRVLARDPARARGAVAQVVATGEDSLAELGRMVGVLDEEAPAQPRVDDLASLVAGFRAAGLPVLLEVVGGQRPLAPAVELAAYRIAQEALTNVLKHAGPGAAATVTVTYGDGSVEVSVADDGMGGAPVTERGHGLHGMRERAAMLGGSFAARAREDGGFLVRADLPSGVAR